MSQDKSSITIMYIKNPIDHIKVLFGFMRVRRKFCRRGQSFTLLALRLNIPEQIPLAPLRAPVFHYDDRMERRENFN